MVNSVILMGRLTRDPDLRHTASNTPVTTFTLAVDRGVKRTNDPAQQTTDFIDIVAWEAKAEFAAKYFRKGQLVAVCGRLQSRKWQDNNGNNRTSIEVIANELHFAESKNATQAATPVQAPQRAAQPVPAVEPIVLPPDQYDDYSGFTELGSSTEELPF
ncbi:MAG: single-stranded DNA-binding protein [Ruminococcus sp.]|nr:single-stranded DNA-binding protein [Ruminococcus sp.]